MRRRTGRQTKHEARSTKHVVNEDKATRYHRLKRQASVASLLWGVALLGGLIWSGLSLALRTSAETLASRAGAPAAWVPPVAAVFYVLLLSALNEIGSLPIAFYSGFVVERRYGLSNERFGGWLRDQAKAFAIGLVLVGRRQHRLLADTVCRRSGGGSRPAWHSRC